MASHAARNAPMYRQVADQLAAEIASGELPPGHRVPSERVIAERHGLSRMTARQAVELLLRRGLVYRRPGSGTYVAAARVEHTLQWFAGFTEQMRAQGIQPGGRVLAVKLSGQDGSDAGAAFEVPGGGGRGVGCRRRLWSCGKVRPAGWFAACASGTESPCWSRSRTSRPACSLTSTATIWLRAPC